MAFRRLFAKEFRSIVPLFGFFYLAVVLLHAFLFYKRNSWDNEVIFVLSLVIPFVVSGLIAVGTGYNQLHAEWKTNSIYLLLSLPVQGWKVLTAKLAAVLSLLVLTVVGIGLSFSVILLRVKWNVIMGDNDFWEIFPTLFNMSFHAFWMYLLTVAFLIVLIQFAFLTSQLVVRLKWLVVAVSFLAAAYFVLRVSPWLSSLLLWLPDIKLGSEDAGIEYMHSGAFVAIVLLGAGMTWLSGLIYDREVEV